MCQCHTLWNPPFPVGNLFAVYLDVAVNCIFIRTSSWIIFTVVHHCINLLCSDVTHLWVMARKALLLLAAFAFFFFFNSTGCRSSQKYSACDNKLLCFSLEQINPLPMWWVGHSPSWFGTYGFRLFWKSIARMLIMSTASAVLVGIAAVRGCIHMDSWNPEPPGCEAL